MLRSITFVNDGWIEKDTNISESLFLNRVIKVVTINTNGRLSNISLSVDKHNACDTCDEYLKYLGYTKDTNTCVWIKTRKAKVGVTYGKANSRTSTRRRVVRNTSNIKSSDI